MEDKVLDKLKVGNLSPRDGRRGVRGQAHERGDMMGTTTDEDLLKYVKALLEDAKKLDGDRSTVILPFDGHRYEIAVKAMVEKETIQQAAERGYFGKPAPRAKAE